MIVLLKVYKYIETNCYLYIDEKTKRCIIIDPGANGREIVSYVRKNNLIVDKILITHGHFDHIGGILDIQKELNVKLYSYKNSDMYLKDPHYNMSYTVSSDIIIEDSIHFDDNDIIKFKENPDMNLKVYYTPGHTEDSCIFYNEKDKICFVGDTIFLGSVGRWDFLGGNYEKLKHSIKDIIFSLPKDTILLPGHEESTTVKREIDYGFFSRNNNM